MKTKEKYRNQIGDTHYKKELDAKEFKFCDSTNVLHKRAYVRYIGGSQALQKEIKSLYDFKLFNTSFSGYFIVRLAVNCQGVAGRFRIESVDSSFNSLNKNEKFESYILSISKRLNNWSKPYYKDKFYDGYTFFVIKFKNGKIDNYEI